VVDHPDFGRMNFPVGAVASLCDTEMSFAPRLGQNTATILGELGCSAKEIETLKDEGVVGI
jgi:crotonobetainyl-CoA:carnitine CoA-transferase CaiB-like acyl-CoA transferase